MRGLGNNNKRRETFNWLRARNQSIYFLQEVHCTENKVDNWRCEWGYEALFSCCSSNASGVGILFNNNFNLTILKVFSDPLGRFILCDIKAEEKLLTLANLYAPNMDDPIFFNKAFNHLKDFKCEELILGGDFNLVLNVEKDKKGGLLRTHQKALAVVNQACEEFNLTDIWRILNPESQRYTWRRRKPEIQCRLDFFLISSSLICDTNQADIAPGYKTDHSIILLEIALHQNPRGRGFWKLNSSLLTDEQYLESIKTVIQQTKTEYMSDNSVNPALLWEMIKMNVREKSISYAIAKTSKSKSREDALYKGIADLEREIDEADGTKGESQIPQLNTKLDNLNCELEKIIEYRTKGAFMRSRIRWHNEGEKNTKYFLSLEKRHYKQGTISRLKKNENEYATSDKDILNVCEAFYKDLYSSKIPTDRVDTEIFFQSNNTVLSSDESESIEGWLTEAECAKALKDMEAGKSPGSDGLPSEFYKTFWSDISEAFVKSLNYGYLNGQLSVSQRRGIIKLIPQKSEELYYIRNWRSLTLLNWFGVSVVQWFTTFYCNSESCILNNGWTSNFFTVHRGVRQGCPLSPYLFVLAVEILAKKIRSNPNIKGFLIKENEIKISQYADDTTLILDGSEKSLSEALNTLESFGKLSGLKLNSKKTEAFWIGSHAGSNTTICPEYNFNWKTLKVKALGVWFSIHPEVTAHLNFQEKN